MNSDPRVTVIIPTINGLHLLKDCLAGLEAQTFRDFEVVVVDDGGSTDGTVDYVRSRHPAVRLVLLDRNRGYAGACNAGFAAARGEYTGVLGNDNRPEPAWLEALVRALDRHPEAAAASSRSIEPTGGLGHPFGWLDVLGYNTAAFPGGPPLDRPTRMSYPTGNAFLLRRQLVDRFFDESYRTYCEDAWLGWRLLLAGHQILYVPDSVTHHLGSQTTSRRPWRRAFYQTRNRYWNALIHFERGMLARLIPWLVLDMMATVLARRYRAARAAAVLSLASDWPALLAKRREAQRKRRIPDRELLPCFAPSRLALLDAFLRSAGARGIGRGFELPRHASGG